MQDASAALNQVLSEIRAKFASSQHQEGVLTALTAFTKAVDWREPWLLAVLASQLLLFGSILLLRKSTAFLTSIFLLRLNGVLAQHWQSFAGQPYFDKNGIFISAILSAPLVADMLIILVLYLAGLSRMLVQMKKQELRHKARQRAKAEHIIDAKKSS